MFGDVKDGSEFHLLSCSSHKRRCPVKSTPAAELLAASEALDELIPLRDALRKVLRVKQQLGIWLTLNIYTTAGRHK